MKISAATDLSRVQSLEELKRFVSIALQEMAQQINGNLQLVANVRPETKEVSIAVANQTVSVEHGLGRTPQGFLVLSQSASGSVYNGTQDHNDRFLYLTASAVMTVRIWAF